MDALLLLMVVLAMTSVSASVLLWACLLMAARSEGLPPTTNEASGV